MTGSGYLQLIDYMNSYLRGLEKKLNENFCADLYNEQKFVY